MEHKLMRCKTIRTGHEYKLVDGKLKEVHDWWVSEQKHRFECNCGKSFNKEGRAIEHLQENQD